MKNLIFITTFLKKEYGDMCLLLLESIKTYYNNDSFELYIFVDKFTTHIIQTYIDNNTNIKFEVKLIQCNINNVVIASSFRMFIFDYIDNTKFNKILYLDTDILINNSLECIFNINIDNKVHVVKEGGYIAYHCLYHTKEEFEKFKTNDCFSSGILLFDNTLKEYIENVKQFFLNGIKSNIQIGCCMDQPFFNLMAHRMNCSNNTQLGQYTKCNATDISTQVITHFAGNVGDHESKLSKMNTFILKNKLF